MKRIIIFCFIAFIFIVFIHAETPEIDILKPLGGVTWVKGTTYEIKWNRSGQMDAEVKIRLMDKTGTNKVLGITDKTDNDGSFDWLVPPSVNVDEYRIRVKTLDNLVQKDSDIFSISGNLPQPASIKVNEPSGSIQWKIGSGYNISWNKSGSMDSNVNITLRNSTSTSEIADIKGNTPNDLLHLWTIPSSITPGQYRVRVRTTDGLVSGDSNIFTIKKKSGLTLKEKIEDPKLQGTIKIIKPSDSTSWNAGKKYDIKWKNMFTKGLIKNVQLYNWNGTQLLRIITILSRNSPAVKSVGDISSYSWNIPKDIGSGDYKIKISVPEGTLKASGWSGKFHIKGGLKVMKYKVRGVVDNRYKYYYWLGNKKYPLKHTTTPSITPMAGAMRIGFENHTTTDRGGQYIGFIYRSFVKFNIDHLKGKGLLLKAKIVYNRQKNSSHCPIRMHFVEKQWSDPFNVVSGYLPNPDNQLTLSAHQWFGSGNNNFGVMFTGADETFQHNNNSCIALTYVVDLELEILTQN